MRSHILYAHSYTVCIHVWYRRGLVKTSRPGPSPGVASTGGSSNGRLRQANSTSHTAAALNKHVFVCGGCPICMDDTRTALSSCRRTPASAKVSRPTSKPIHSCCRALEGPGHVAPSCSSSSGLSTTRAWQCHFTCTYISYIAPPL